MVEPDAEAALGVDLADYLGSPIERHPEMVAATLQFERAAHAVAAARAEYLPNVGVYAQHFYQRALPFVPPSQFSFGVKLEWTIWDFRQRGYALAERQAQREQGRLEVERVRRRLESEVAKASRSVHRAQEGVAVAAETLAARREAERLAADQQGAGIVLPAVALAAVAARLQSEADLLQAQLGVRLAVAVLKRAAGRDR